MTIEELIQAARIAVEGGDLDKARQLTDKAQAMKNIEALTPAVDVEKLKTKIVELEAFKAKIENEPATNTGGTLLVTEDEADKANKAKPFTGLGDFLMTVKQQARGVQDQRLLSLRSNDPLDEGGYNLTKAVGPEVVGSLFGASQKGRKAITGLGTQAGDTGGFLVDTDRNLSIMERVYTTGQILQRVDLTGISNASNGMTFNFENETSRADGSRRGGIRGYWLGEGGSYTGSKPSFRQIELKLKKAGALVYATDEQLADAMALESYIMRNLPGELRFVVEDGIINGTGAGQPLGILNSGAVVSIDRKSVV